MLTEKQHRRGCGHRADQTAFSGARQSLANAGKCPSQQNVEQDERQRARCHREQDEPRSCNARQHRDDIGNVSKVPVEIDGAAIQGGSRHIGVPADDEQHPQTGQPSERWGRRFAEPSRSEHHDKQAHGQLDGQPGPPADGRRRPDVLERQRRVEKEDNDCKRRPAPPLLIDVHNDV